MKIGSLVTRGVPLAMTLFAMLLPAMPATAGRLGGGGVRAETVSAWQTDRYNMAFRGDETALIVVLGEGDTDLDLLVYDRLGNLVASDTDGSDFCIARWTPARMGQFRVEVRNLGSVYNRYSFMTN